MSVPADQGPRGDAAVWIAGATGLVGSALLQRLLERPDVLRVTAIVRRSTGLINPKLLELVIDFERLEAELAGRSATHVFCCLGTTIAAAGSQEAFRRVDHDYPLALGRAARKAGARQLLVVTAMGANPKSRVFYNRVKGELEQDLRALGISDLHLLRPSLLLGDRKEKRSGERFAAALAAPMKVLLVGPLRRYRPIAGRDVAEAMLHIALDYPALPNTVTVHRSDRIAAAARRSQALHPAPPPPQQEQPSPRPKITTATPTTSTTPTETTASVPHRR
jgi:uncharacterized protein YbjT (DUF2867 family)